MDNQTPLISVITPSYNQKKSIEFMMDAWQEQLSVFSDFELIISDDGSSDQTGDMVAAYKDFYKYPITFIPHAKDGFRIAQAKNDAIRTAKGKYILVMDGDTFPDENTVTAFLPHLDENTVLHAKRHRVAPQVMDLPFSWENLHKFKTRGEWRAEKLPDLPPGRYTVFSGANCIIPAKWAKEMLWAPDDWVGYGYDDYNFALRWIASGKKIKFVDSVAWHIEHGNSIGDPVNRKKIQELEQQLTPEMRSIYGLSWSPPYV